MNRFWLPAIALFALTAKAQNINFQDIPHLHTSMNHLTVIDLGEPIQFIAAADPQSFQIERAGDKVLIQPLKEAATTNLILWTASRQVSYELDAPGDAAQMNVLVRNLPAPTHAATSAPTSRERDEIASAAISTAMLDAQDVVPEKPIHAPTGIETSIIRVLHTSQGTYLQYQVVNHSTSPFRVTTPSVTRLSPTQTPVSLLALRNHQLSSQTLNSLKARPDGSAPTVVGRSGQTDVAAGSSTTGYVLLRTSSGVPEIYRFSFGSSTSGPLVDTVVI